jgi:DNA polymerase-4
VKAKYANFRIVTRSASLARPVAGLPEFLAIGAELLDRLLPPPMGVRLLGIGLSGLLHPDADPEEDPVQPTLALWDAAP